MALKEINTNFTNQNKANKKKPNNLSLNIHIMPKTETGHFKKWLVLSFLVFILIIIGILFLI